ncbi:MAG: hypothetical protein R3C05_30620 [Pirellulaceae bacterium]
MFSIDIQTMRTSPAGRSPIDRRLFFNAKASQSMSNHKFADVATVIAR